jgi:glycosyltransferase involved in cell wall biosynthesis
MASFHPNVRTGGAVHFLELERALRGLIDVEVTTLRPTQWIPGFSLLYNLIAIVMSLRIHPDLVYFRRDSYFIAPVFIGRMKNIPVVAEVNGIPDHEWKLLSTGSDYITRLTSALKMILDRATLRGCSMAITVSREIEAWLITCGGFMSNQVKVIHNGVDLDRFRPSPGIRPLRGGVEQTGIPVCSTETKPTIGFVGLNFPWHHLDELVAAAVLLADDAHPFNLVFIGPDLRRSLEPAILKAGLEDRTTFTGQIPHDQIPEMINRLDVAVALNSQGSPLKLYEYLGCGVPVLANKNLVRYCDIPLGPWLRLVDVTQIAEIADSILELSMDTERTWLAELRESMQEHSWSRVAEKVTEEISSLIVSC